MIDISCEDTEIVNLSELKASELILIRQWLSTVANAGSVGHVRRVADFLCDVDKELWHRLIGDSSPWDGAKRYAPDPEFKDNEFEETLKSIREGKPDDTGEQG